MEDLAAFLDQLCERTRNGWAANPDLVQVDARREAALLSTGYADRQIAELVQNAVDAAVRHATARIELRLTATHLYAANTGEPVSGEGVRALVYGDLSPKGGEEIGRFGLGFRSLLRLGGRVDVHSAGIAFRFDPAWCATEARRAARLPPDAPAPGFRLAQRLNAAAEQAEDRLLAELCGWADTVIRAELAAADAAEAMRREMERFPAEVLLFSVPDIRLRFVLPDKTRLMRRRRRGDVMRLLDGERRSTWRLFQERFAIDDEAARRDAGQLQARDAVTITWAVPLRGPRRGGELWNAFPTRTASCVAGILDTRWKVNSDRTALTGEAWNAALMRCAAKLIARSLPALVRRKDPGLPLDALPRELERRDEPSAPLHDALWQEVRGIAFLADGTGALRRPAELKRPPLDESALQERWEKVAAAADRAATVHHSCLSSSERRSRLERLARRLEEEPGGGSEEQTTTGFRQAKDRLSAGSSRLARWPAEAWLAAIADPDPSRGREAVLLAAELVSREVLYRHRLRELAIIPTRDGGLAKASEAVLPGGAVPPGRKAVHPDLIADEAVRQALENVFRIGVMDDAAWLSVLQEAWPRDREPRPEECAAGWELLLAAPEPVRERFLREDAERLRFPTRSGAWRTRDGVLLPGRIVAEDEAEAHRDVLLDPAFATRAGSLLAALEIGDMPPDHWREEFHVTGAQVAWLAELDLEAAWVYRRKRNLTSYPQYRTLGYLRPVRYPAGLPLLTKVKGEGLVRLSSLLLRRLEGGPTVQHQVGGRGEARTLARYPPITAPDPSAWLLWMHGAARIGTRVVRLRDVSALLRTLNESERSTLGPLLPDDAPLRRRWIEGWPEPDGSDAPVWQALLDPALVAAPEQRRALWEAAARRGHVPDPVPFIRGAHRSARRGPGVVSP